MDISYPGSQSVNFNWNHTLQQSQTCKLDVAPVAFWDFQIIQITLFGLFTVFKIARLASEQVPFEQT